MTKCRYPQNEWRHFKQTFFYTRLKTDGRSLERRLVKRCCTCLFWTTSISSTTFLTFNCHKIIFVELFFLVWGNLKFRNLILACPLMSTHVNTSSWSIITGCFLRTYSKNCEIFRFKENFKMLLLKYQRILFSRSCFVETCFEPDQKTKQFSKSKIF